MWCKFGEPAATPPPIPPRHSRRAMPSRDYSPLDSFMVYTEGHWTVSDVQSFISSADHVYGVFLTVQLATKQVLSEQSRREWRTQSLTEYVSPRIELEDAGS